MPAGSLVRIVSVGGALSALAVFDQLIIKFNTSAQTWAVAASMQLHTNVIEFWAALGVSHNVQTISQTDPATGDSEFSTEDFTVQLPLPDIWWPMDLQILVESRGAAISNTLIAYERMNIVTRTGDRRKRPRSA